MEGGLRKRLEYLPSRMRAGEAQGFWLVRRSLKLTLMAPMVSCNEEIEVSLLSLGVWLEKGRMRRQGRWKRCRVPSLP